MSAVEEEVIQCRRIRENVRCFRGLGHMTQECLGRAARLSAHHIGKIERMRTLTGVSNFALLKIADALGIPFCVLMSDDATCPVHGEIVNGMPGTQAYHAGHGWNKENTCSPMPSF